LEKSNGALRFRVRRQHNRRDEFRGRMK